MELKFKTPVHRKGLNMTVRAGTKWIGRIEADVEGLGLRSIRCMAMRFDDISDTVIELFHHDNNCHDRLGLVSAMNLLYGKVEPSAIVTLVFYNDQPEGMPR